MRVGPLLSVLLSVTVGTALASTAFGAPPGEDPAPPATKDEARDAKAEHSELEKGFRKARSEYYAARKTYNERKATGDAAEAVEAPTPPEGEWLARYFEAADRHAGTEDAVPFLVSIVSIASRPEPAVAKKALERLATTHVNSPRLADLTFSLIYYGRSLEGRTAEDAIDRIYDDSPHGDVKAAMLYAGVSMEKRNGPQPTAARRADLVETLEKAIAHAPESRWAGLAKGDIYELQNLQIGMTAPDIVGEDLAGVAFKLSDYRGKVVVLDFWGDW